MAPLCKVFSYLCGRGDADSLREILTPVFSLYDIVGADPYILKRKAFLP